MTASYRFAVADDRQFIVSGWSSSFRLSRDCTTPMPMYARHKHEEIGYYLDAPWTRTLVAHGHVLQGFLSYRPPTSVLYVYVAQPFRRRGIARGLFDAAGIDPASRFTYVYRTSWSARLRSKVPYAAHDPLPVRFGDEERRP